MQEGADWDSTAGSTLKAMLAETHFLWSILMDFRPFQSHHHRSRQPLPVIQILDFFPGNPARPWTDILSYVLIYPRGRCLTCVRRRLTPRVTQCMIQPIGGRDNTKRRRPVAHLQLLRKLIVQSSRKVISMLQNSIDRYTSFDATYTPRRGVDKISQIENRIKNLKDRYGRECTSCK